MLTHPFGHVNIITQDAQVKYPEVKDAFKPEMAALLQHFWGVLIGSRMNSWCDD